MRVRVHRNLKHGRASRPLYSILHKGKVIARRHRVLLSGVKFIVRKSGCAATRGTRRKNVHAFVEGNLVDSRGVFGTDADGKDLPMRVTYNPYKACAFLAEGKWPVTGARAALLNEHGLTAAYLED